MNYPEDMGAEEIREFEEEWARFGEGEFEQWVEEHSQWLREQEEAEFAARVDALNRELRLLAAA